jgi:hypothetical protein
MVERFNPWVRNRRLKNLEAGVKLSTGVHLE